MVCLVRGAAAPHQSHAGAGLGSQSLLPHGHFVRAGTQIRHACWHRGQGRATPYRCAHQWAIQIKRWQGVALAQQGVYAGQRLEQSEERRLDLQNNPGAAICEHLRVAGELDGVAQALLGMNQEGLALQIFLTQPYGLGEVAADDLEGIGVPAPVVLGETCV